MKFQLMLCDNAGTVLDTLELEIGGDGYDLTKGMARQCLSQEILDMIQRAAEAAQ